MVTGLFTGCKREKTDPLESKAKLQTDNPILLRVWTFTLGFFTPEGTNRTYLAIRFTVSTWSKPVWIGNRDTPFPANSSAQLLIDGSGRLILAYDEQQGTPYRISSKKTSRNVAATLQDSGNFVLRERNADGSFGRELWSSFDNPTDTLLPGMKLGVDHRRGKNWTLTSWRRDDSPAAGAFSLEWDPTKRRLVIKNRGVAHWTSGELMNATDFRHSPTHKSAYDGVHIFKFVNVSAREEEYFSYAVTLDPSGLPFFSPEEQIKLRLAGWRLDPEDLLFVTYNGTVIVDAGECYGYENETQQSKGCQLWRQPICRAAGGLTFKERSGSFINYTGVGGEEPITFTTHNSSASLSDCRESCWKDCDCVGYGSYGDDEERNISAVSTGQYRSDVVLFIEHLIKYLLPEQARKEQELKDLFTLEEYTDVHELDKGESGNSKVFSYDWAVATTNNFSPQYKLGQGGFGGVYKAWELWNRGAVLQLVDPTLNSIFGSEEQLHRCINVGLLCVEELAVDRPSMSDVISMLTNENLDMARPKKPAFVLRYSAARGFQEDESNKLTVNQLSISAIEAR
nr:G-type lectin S-receptor-like serine/threonine-protein kinase At1g67520 [Ipomoea batatas]